MGSFHFRWEHPAKEVFVTGTFDNWGKTVKLEKHGDVFEKVVDLPEADKDIYYKFVVDDTWTTDHTAPQRTDDQNNLNNILTPDRIVKHSASEAHSAALMSAPPPSSTSANLAKNVPLEKSQDPSGMPGHFPETPAQEPAEFSVNPIPATEGAGNPVHLKPGEKVPDPSTLTANTIHSTVKDDKSLQNADDPQQTFSVSPIPATAGAGNPISLKPGEKVPEPNTISANTIQSTVTTDKESYEKGGSALSGPPILPNVVTPQNERDAKGTGILDLPPISNNMIPESSLPIGNGTAKEQDVGPFISSAAPDSTTAALASQVPKEPTSNGEGATSQASPQKNGDQSSSITAAGAATAVAGTATASLTTLKDKVVGAAGGETKSSPQSGEAGVPEVVKESISQAHQGPEATANPEAVLEKKAVEGELLKQVHLDESSGKHAPTTDSDSAAQVPDVVKKSVGSGSLEAAGNPEALAEKTEVEKELLKEVKRIDEPEGKAASSDPAVLKSDPNGPAAGATSTAESPATKQPDQPTVTTGTESNTAPSTSPPAVASGTPESPASGKKEKERRRSGFFGGIRDGRASQDVSRQGEGSSTSKPEGKRSSFFRKLTDKLKH